MSNNKLIINSFLSFRIGVEIFCINVNKILNILEMHKITKVPKSPEYMLGLINLRGEVIPVIDTRIRFGIEVSDITKNTCIIVMDILMDNESSHIGILVDAVLEVFEADEKSILPQPGIGTKYKTEFIIGVIKKSDNFILLLDVDKVFNSEELVIINETEQENSFEIN